MTNPSGANPRFKGPGSLWKTSWKGRHVLGESMPFLEGFIFDFPSLFGAYFDTAALAGAGAGFWRGAVIFIKPGIESITDQEAVGATEAPDQPAAAVGGWRLFIGTDQSLNFEIGATSGAFPVAKTLAGEATALVSSPDQLTPVLAVPILGIFRGDGASLELRVTGGAPHVTSFAGLVYRNPTVGQSGTVCAIGCDSSNDGNCATNLGINGIVGGAGIPSAGQISQWFADVKTQLTTPTIPGLTTDQWTCNPYIDPNQWRVPAPTTIENQVGAPDMGVFETDPSPLTLTNYQVLFNY